MKLLFYHDIMTLSVANIEFYSLINIKEQVIINNLPQLQIHEMFCRKLMFRYTERNRLCIRINQTNCRPSPDFDIHLIFNYL